MKKERQEHSHSDTNNDITVLRNGLRTQWLALSLGLALIASIFGYQSFSSFRDITRQEHLRLQTQAGVIASNVEWSLEATNVTLASLVKDIDYLRRRNNLQLANRRLEVLTDAMPGIRTIFVLDAEGTVIVSNRQELLGRNFRSRDYFATPAKNNNPSTLYLSPPFKTVLGSFLINISRVIPDAHGGFNGVVTAALDPAYFQVLLNSVLYAPDMLSAINHGDGIRFMIVPDQNGQSGKNLALPGTFYTRHRDSGRHESVLTGRSPSYPSERVMALHTVQPQKLHMDKPLYVACSREYSAIYQGWRDNNLKQLFAFALIGLTAGVSLELLQRRQQVLAIATVRNKELMKFRLDLLEYAGTHTLQELLSHASDEVRRLSSSPANNFLQDNGLSADLDAIVREIADRKRSEEERFNLGVRYKTLQSVSRDGIHILDQNGNLMESNSAFRQMLGYTGGNEMKLHVKDWNTAIPHDELTAKIRELIHAPAIFETTFRHKDGTLFDVEISACGVQLDGEWHLYSSARDISKRKEMETSLRESRQFLSDVFDFLPDATFVVDRNKAVIAWNRAMEEMSGVPKEQMLGQGDHAFTVPFYGDRRPQLIDLIDGDDTTIESGYQRVSRLGKSISAETFCPLLRNDKGAHVWAKVAPLYDGDGKRIGAVESIRDITAIKETEANLERSNRELELFAYVASHDLQEPLRKIAGFTELLANRCKGALDEKAETYMAYIVDGAARMRLLINDILSYSRVIRSDKKFTMIDCSGLIAKVLRDMELAIKESNTEIVCGPLPAIQADQTQVRQLFQNLIGNAIKYRGAAFPRITISATLQGNSWLFSVADNGIGIAPEYFERIFVIFQRLHTRSEYSGTGIGLAICQKIVERHGGKIWLESTPGAGSTFFFTIPSTPV